MITKLNPDAIKNNSITIDKLADVHSVTWDEKSNINNFIKQGRYFISGERTSNEDGLPIGKLTDSNNFNAELLVLEQNVAVDYSKQYFTIEALESGNISFGIPSSVYLLKYRKNNEQWIETTDAVQIPVTNGDKIQISCICDAFSKYYCSSIFDIDVPYIVYGNIMSLLYGDDFKDKTDLTEKNTSFRYLFANNKTLKNAENLILPATTLANNCYYSMFENCTSLVTTPELPATTLANNCYSYMFYGCTSLVTAPELPATTLADLCYQGMFNSCTSLNKVTMLATDISAFDCLQMWLYNVAPEGTFVKHPDMTSLSPDSEYGVPLGWELMDYVSENNVQKNNENKNSNHIITQKLTISTSEGNSDTYTRTGIGSTSNDIKWKNWGKLQQFIDLGKELEISKLDEIIDNGIYTGTLGEWGLMGPFTLLVLNDQEFIQESTSELEGVFKRSIVQILFNANTFSTSNDLVPITLCKRYGVGNDNIKWEEWVNIDEYIIKINYSDLKKLKNYYGLRPGMKYYITDYKASSTQENTTTNENSYPVIIVEAVDRNILNENALYLEKSCISEIKYCLDNDTSRFAWADPDNGKGVIYYMKDEYGNEAPYDFKNILYLKDGKEVPTFGANCSNNIIKEYKVDNIINLPNITFGDNCTGNTFGNDCKNNTFQNNCSNNTFEKGCNNNTFGKFCTNNTFGNNCEYITFAQNVIEGSSNNTIGNECYCIYLYNSSYNTIDDYCGIKDEILVKYADPGNYFTITGTCDTIIIKNSKFNHIDKYSNFLFIEDSTLNTIKNDRLVVEEFNLEERKRRITYDYISQSIYNSSIALSKGKNEHENDIKNYGLCLNNTLYCLICKSTGEFNDKKRKIIGYTLE